MRGLRRRKESTPGQASVKGQTVLKQRGLESDSGRRRRTGNSGWKVRRSKRACADAKKHEHEHEKRRDEARWTGQMSPQRGRGHG